MTLKSSLRGVQAMRRRYDLAMGGGPLTYIQKVLGYDPIAYWPENETAGATIVDRVNVAQNGTYTGVALNDSTGPDGQPVGRWDGANDYGNVFTTTFRDAFDGTEMTLMAWLQMFNVGVWTDGAARDVFNFDAGAGNRYRLSKVANNVVQFQDRSSVAKDINFAGLTDIDWMHFAVTRSETADQLIGYKDGAQVGVTVAALGNWTFTLALCISGAFSLAPAFVANGWLAHLAVFNTALPPAAIADLATV